VTVGDDAPDREALEAELERCRAMLLQSAKLADLGQQVASLVHEMNQPLLGIKAFAQMLKKELGNDESARRKATFIEEQAIVLERMAARVRRHSRRSDTDRNARVDVEKAVEGVLTLLSHRVRKAGVSTEVDLAPGLPRARMTDIHMQQLLVNLVGNAADALRETNDRRLRILGRTDGDGVRLVVADSGPGIPEDVLANIFEPFFTTKDAAHGTGLGLPITLEIVKAYGGTLEVRRGEEAAAVAGDGMSTAFEIRLPGATGG
jgi:two-component system C4-dicarboxylate transport sensor histidine kinase DctB